jgi:hypothetical protein
VNIAFYWAKVGGYWIKQILDQKVKNWTSVETEYVGSEREW